MRHWWILVFCFPLASLAQDQASWNKEYLTFYGGYFDVTQDDDAAAQFGLEYRFQSIYRGLRPAIGVNYSADDAVYGYAGLFWDIFLSDRWVFTPNFVAGGFTHGEGKNLGNGLQFRSGLELSYQFNDMSRLGLNFNHISNASLGSHNPGAETLLVVYQHPLNMFSAAPKKPYKAPDYKPKAENDHRWWQRQ